MKNEKSGTANEIANGTARDYKHHPGDIRTSMRGFTMCVLKVYEINQVVN